MRVTRGDIRKYHPRGNLASLLSSISLKLITHVRFINWQEWRSTPMWCVRFFNFLIFSQQNTYMFPRTRNLRNNINESSSLIVRISNGIKFNSSVTKWNNLEIFPPHFNLEQIIFIVLSNITLVRFNMWNYNENYSPEIAMWGNNFTRISKK